MIFDKNFRFVIQIINTNVGFALERFDTEDSINRDILWISTSLVVIEQKFMDLVSLLANHAFAAFEQIDFTYTRALKKVEYSCFREMFVPSGVFK